MTKTKAFQHAFLRTRQRELTGWGAGQGCHQHLCSCAPSRPRESWGTARWPPQTEEAKGGDERETEAGPGQAKASEAVLTVSDDRQQSHVRTEPRRRPGTHCRPESTGAGRGPGQVPAPAKSTCGQRWGRQDALAPVWFRLLLSQSGRCTKMTESKTRSY